jgi:hypothetical protein
MPFHVGLSTGKLNTVIEDSSITKTGRHNIAEILLKMALNNPKINQSIIKVHI